MRSRLALLGLLTVSCQAGPQTRVAEDGPAVAGVRLVSQGEPPAARREITDSVEQSRLSAIVVAADRAAPAVVSVNVVRRQRAPRSVFEWFWAPRGYEREVQGLGSGFVVSEDGIVITNEHVTAGATEIVVTTREGTDYPAELLGADPHTDIAVLKIDGVNLPTVTIGRSTDLMIGEWVVAIGNPYGYLLGNSEPTVTAGVVSAINRNLIPSGQDQTIYVGMIQTDAAINPGNSGGPLLNALGEVVGVNSSIFSQSGGSVGIGFAIPIERALRVARELRVFGEVRRSWVGLSVAGSERLRQWKERGGLPVVDVAEDGPAAAVGIRGGDILVSVNGRRVRTFLDWEAAKLDVSPGDSLTLELRRNGRVRSVRVGVTDLPTSVAERVSVLGAMELITVTPAVRQERGIRSEEGALIYRIAESARRRVGLQDGDVIVQINSRRVASAEDVRQFFRDVAGGRVAVRVVAERGGGLFMTTFYVQ